MPTPLEIRVRSIQSTTSKIRHQLATIYASLIQLNRNHGDRVDSPGRARFPKATTRLLKPQARLASGEVEEGGQGWKEILQGRWARLQDTESCD